MMKKPLFLPLVVWILAVFVPGTQVGDFPTIGPSNDRCMIGGWVLASNDFTVENAITDPPAAPTDCDATDDLCNYLWVCWTDNSDDERGFYIYRDAVKIDSMGADDTCYVDITGSCGIIYQYCVAAYNDSGESGKSCDYGSLKFAPAAPTECVASDTLCGGVSFSWTDNSGCESGFVVYRDASALDTVGASVTSYDDSTAAPGRTYAYGVTAYNECGESPQCADAGTVLAPPAGPYPCLASDDFPDVVSFCWTDNSNNESGFIVYRGGLALDTVGADSTRYDDLTAAPGTIYSYCVSAFNECGESSECCDNGSVSGPPTITCPFDGIIPGGACFQSTDFIVGNVSPYYSVTVHDVSPSPAYEMPYIDETYVMWQTAPLEDCDKIFEITLRVTDIGGWSECSFFVWVICNPETTRVFDPGCGDKLILAWHECPISNHPDFEGYYVWRREAGHSTSLLAGPVTDTVFLDQGLQAYKTYYYQISILQCSHPPCYWAFEGSGIPTNPVVLVHGLWAHKTVWGPMESYLRNDGFQHVWVPELNGWGGHQENAATLHTFIEGQKDSLRDSVLITYGLPDVRPSKVNLIGHSMGGVISRLYVHNFNQDVDHLIMLGTPNAGNRSARFRASLPGACQAIRELTPQFMTQVFDVEWGIDNVPGVHYHAVAGDYPWYHWWWCRYVYYPNDPSPNDEVVAVSSVFHTPAEDQIKTEMYHDNHRSIRENEETYESLIFPWLTGSNPTPVLFAEESYSVLGSFQEIDTSEQLLPTHLDSVFSGENKQHALMVDSSSVVRLGISWCSGNLDVVLYDPYGTLIDSAYAENTDSVVRGLVEGEDSYRMEFYAMSNPSPGNWLLEVRGTDVSDSGEKYWIEGVVENNLRLVGRTDSEFYNPSDTVVITGELRRDTVAILGADVAATINGPDQSFGPLTLFDDGVHGDGQENDGVYANTFSNTSLYGSYGLSITASGSLRNTSFSREWLSGFLVSDLTFLRGDANRDGIIDVGDVVHLINYLYKGGIAPYPSWLGDCNCDEVIELGDVVYLINYLFKSGPPPSC